MTIAVDLGRKAFNANNKQTNKQIHFSSIAMHSSIQFQIRSLKYVLKKVISRKQITHQRTKSVECENFLGQTSFFVKFVIQALMRNRPRPLTHIFLTDFISNNCFR